MKKSIIDHTTLSELNNRYSRESQNIRFDLMLNTTFVIVGLGASGPMIEQFSRLGIKKYHLFDHDSVELKNVISQSYTVKDDGLEKAEATKRIIEACEFEKGNPNIPPIEIYTYDNFLNVTDAEIEEIIQSERKNNREVIFVITTDYHPPEARASRIGLKLKVPVFWVSLYRMGMAGEIIFYVPGHGLPCYRCITESRYNFFDKTRLANHLKGDFSGSGRSAGLPMAATYVDSILGHLVIGYIHREIDENQHGRFFRRLLREKRNFIQCQLDPDYRLNGENIFDQIKAEDAINFNTIFQQDGKKTDCIDCMRFSSGFVWNHTDYTKENYREILERFSKQKKFDLTGSRYEHPLLSEYSSLFAIWEKLQR
jgi:hypothetical protein